MKRIAKRYWFVPVVLLSLGFAKYLPILSGCGSSSVATEEGRSGAPLSEDTLTIKVEGAASSTDTCVISGETGRELGTGAPTAISYHVGIERAAIVTCGSLAAVFQIGDETVTLTAVSTAVANKLAGQSMGPGTLMLASMLADLETAAQTSTSAKGVMGMKGLGNTTGLVSDSLVEIASALSTLASPTDLTAVKNAIIKILVNSGEPVVIENVGAGKTLSACTTAAAATFSTEAVAVDAATIGLTGCLVYHSQDAVFDLNDPLGAPANNIPASFRSVAKESGVVQKLVDSFVNNSYVTMASVNNYIFSLLGHTVYSQDDEGVTTDRSISATDMSNILLPFLGLPGGDNSGGESTITTSTNLKSYRFHEGYNPSGGWEINAAATLQTLPVECVDSDKDTVCPVQPLKFDFNGTTLTPNASGNYIVEMQYLGGVFTSSAYVIDVTTGTPYRNAFYQPVQVTIVPADYSAIDYANPLYQAALDPMNDGAGNSAPFSNADWRTKYPAMNNVANTYLFPTPEAAARQFAVLLQDTNLTNIPALQAYIISKLMTGGMAAFRVGTNYDIFRDHGKTLTNWESITATWLAAATPSASVTVTGTTRVETGLLTIRSATCKNSLNQTVTCTVASTIRLNQTGQVVSGGTQFNITSGTMTVNSATLGATTITYSPTYLLVATDNKSAQLLGDLNLSFSFTGTGIASKITSGSRIQPTYSMKVYAR